MYSTVKPGRHYRQPLSTLATYYLPSLIRDTYPSTPPSRRLLEQPRTRLSNNMASRKKVLLKVC
jgi:hypothetical protein